MNIENVFDNQNELKKGRKIPLSIMAGLLAVGLAGLIAIDWEWITNHFWNAFIEHVSIALIIAAVLGTTYEYFLHRERERLLRSLLDENRQKIFEALHAYGILTPKEIFDLLREVAKQTNKIPTLYQPPRDYANEYTFAKSIKYFDTLHGVRRQQMISVMEDWIKTDTSTNVKFLAGDFIGRYFLRDLAPELRRQIEPILESGHLDEEKRYWVLNYLWAVSRCEEPMYETLTSTLCNCDNEEIEEWIVFVPIQMPSRELGEMLDTYLRSKPSIPEKTLKLVVRAAAALQKNGHKGGELIKRHRQLFNNINSSEIRRIWSNYALDGSMIHEIGESAQEPNKANSGDATVSSAD